MSNYRAFCRPHFQIRCVLHDVAEGRKIIVALVAVHAVIYGDKPNIVVREIGVGIVADLQIVTPQAGHIFYDHGGYITGLNILQHILKARTIEICSCVAVICIAARVGETVFLRVFGEQFLLRCDLSRVNSPSRTAKQSEMGLYLRRKKFFWT